MRIYSRGSELAFKLFTFPDGQPHFQLETEDDGGFRELTIETAIRNPQELFELLLAKDVLAGLGYSVGLDVRYLMGARMDRRIDPRSPFTLQVVASQINSAGFSRVRLLDVHSEVAERLIRNSENLLPREALDQTRRALGNPTIVCPDKGAVDRVQALTGYGPTIVYCEKKRDSKTGKLSGFTVTNGLRIGDSLKLLIVDDLCDGGATFTGLSKELRARLSEGQQPIASVNLFVTHGIFSKGLPLEGIDRVFTTDSYCKPAAEWDATARGQDVHEHLTIIPVSMQTMKG